MTDLVALLARKLGSSERTLSLLESNRETLGVDCEPTDPGLVAMSLCSLGVPPEEVSSLLSWKEFESFCADVLRSAGFMVRENVHLRKPAAQIDIVAKGISIVLSIDCKHWKRGASASALARVAQDQNKRNKQLRATIPDAPPIISVVLTLAQQSERFASGAAVVPLFALRSFLNSIDDYRGLLDSF